MAHENFHYSLTCRVPDLAVVACLRGLAYHVQKGGGGSPNISSSGTGEDVWESGQQAKFYFTGVDRRLTFINDAARLLGGHWTLLAMNDDDLAPRARPTGG